MLYWKIFYSLYQTTDWWDVTLRRKIISYHYNLIVKIFNYVNN